MADVCPKCGIQAVENGVCEYCGAGNGQDVEPSDTDTSEGASEGDEVDHHTRARKPKLGGKKK